MDVVKGEVEVREEEAVVAEEAEEEQEVAGALDANSHQIKKIWIWNWTPTWQDRMPIMKTGPE